MFSPLRANIAAGPSSGSITDLNAISLSLASKFGIVFGICWSMETHLNRHGYRQAAQHVCWVIKSARGREWPG